MIILKIAAYLVIGLYFIALVLIMLYCMVQFHLLIKYLYYKPDNKLKQSLLLSDDNLPKVTIQLPVFNEPMVLNRLIDQIVKLDYPAHRLQIQILDDSTDETKVLCAQKATYYKSQGINIELIHREDRKGYKAGALQNGLETATGELIAIFDADFLPPVDFLKLTVTYFANKEIGVVQTRWRHVNEDYSIITRLQAFQLNVHFSVEQSGRENGGYYLQFNGTAGVWRKATIEDAGGWNDDTLTEDLNLSYRAQLKGWKIHYCQNITSPAELPVEMQGLKSQQFRWMKGGAENARMLLPVVLRSPLSFAQKLHGFSHLLSSSVFLIVFLLAILSVPVLFLYPTIELNLKLFWPFIFSVLLLAFVYFVANSDTSWKNDSLLKRAARFAFMFPVFLSLSMGLSWHTSKAIIEGFKGKKSPFIRTPKFNILGNQNRLNKNNLSQHNNSGAPWMEGILTLYFLMAVLAGFLSGDYSFLLYHLMLVLGFGSIFIFTFQHQYLQ